MIRYFTSCDSYERHYLMAYLVCQFSPSHVLDFGGEGALARFLGSGIHVDTVNVNGKGNVTYLTNQQIMAEDDSYDVAVSLDTFEHIDKQYRPVLVGELCRIARTSVVIAAPYGSPEHIEYERAALASLPKTANPIFGRYLEEHVRFGLPSAEELRSYFNDNYTVSLYFAGRFDNQPVPVSGWRRYRALGKRLVTNLRLTPQALSPRPFPFCNRIYCVATPAHDR